MKRRKGRATRVLGIGLLCTLGTGVAVGVAKLRSDRAEPTPLLAIETSSRTQISAKQAGGMSARPAAAAAPAQGAKPPVLLVTQAPATRPAEAAGTAEGAGVATATKLPTGPGATVELRPDNLPGTAAGAVKLTGNPLADGQSLADRGDVIGARAVLNEGLLGGRLSESDAAAARQRLAKLNESIVFSRRAYRDDPFGGVYTVRSGENLQTIARQLGVSWELLARLNGIADPRRLRAGQALKVIRGPFHAVVSKGAFTLDLYLGSPGGAGSMFVTSFGVGLGKDSSTPTGSWVAHNKLKNPEYYSPRGEGIVAADDPRNPLGEYWIGLRGTDGAALGSESYGIHGTIEPESIGKEESMGCIRLINEDAGRVFEMLVEGKSVVIVRE